MYLVVLISVLSVISETLFLLTCIFDFPKTVTRIIDFLYIHNKHFPLDVE